MFFEYLYMDMITIKSFLITVVIYLIWQLNLTQSIVSLFFIGFSLLFVYTGILLFYGAELFGTLLLLTELIVFFYGICIYLSITHTTITRKIYGNIFFVAMLCYSGDYIYIDYFFKNWYIVTSYIDNDVTVIFLTLYHWYPSLLILVGEFLTVVTFVLLLWFNVTSRGVNKKQTVRFHNQQQEKHSQIKKKGLVFKSSRYDL